MTERLRSGSYTNTKKVAMGGPDLGPKKTMLVLVIVVGCFAVLWPKVFYPMLVGSAQQHIKPSAIDRTTGCCDVISEIDINTIKIMSELCRTIIKSDENATPLTGREIVAQCRKAVLETCGIDISAVLQEQVRLGQTTKQILHEIRSLNGSLCLKYNFGVSPSKLGVPHRITLKVAPSNIRQERPPHLRSEMVHPAFRERGRAIPQTQSSSPSRPPPKVVEGRPGPIPGMRPPMGGAGHVVPAKQSTTGAMGLIMPVYTIGIVIFFTYTVMKILFKKQPEALYPPVEPDPVFRREVFESNRGHLDPKLSRIPASKLVVNAMSALLDEVDQELAARRKASTGTEQDVVANGKLHHQEDQASVKVMGMEMTASCEGNKKWSRPDSPGLPTPQPQHAEPPEPPQEIYLEGALPPQSNHLIVADSATETQKVNLEEDPAVVLAGKMTLSVISLDSSENGTDESSGRKSENERSSSNVSDDFEKVEIEDQINNIIQEAENYTLNKNLIDNTKETVDTLDIQTIEAQNQLENVTQDIAEIHKEIYSIDNESDELRISQYQDEISEDTESGKLKEDLLDPTLSLQKSTDENDTFACNAPLNDDLAKFLQTEMTGTSHNTKRDEDGSFKETQKAIEETPADITEDSKVEEHLLPPTTEFVDISTDEQSEESTQFYDEKNNTEQLDTDIKEIIDQLIQEEAAASETLYDLNEPNQSKETKLSEEQYQTSEVLRDVKIPKEVADHEDTVENKIEKAHSESIQETDKESLITKDSGEILTVTESTIKVDNLEKKVETMKIPEEVTDSKTDLQNIEGDLSHKAEANETVEFQTENILEQVESKETKDFKKILEDLNAAVLGLSSELNPSRSETATEDPKTEEKVPQPLRTEVENIELDEPEDDEDVEYEYEYEEESDSENINDEIRDIDRIEDSSNIEQVGRVNGDHLGTSSNATIAERDISDEENLINENNEDEDEIIQEIIEYISDDEELDEELEPSNINHINDTESANQ